MVAKENAHGPPLAPVARGFNHAAAVGTAIHEIADRNPTDSNSCATRMPVMAMRTSLARAYSSWLMGSRPSSSRAHAPKLRTTSALEMVSAMMALHEGACNVSASLEEQALVISLLEQNVVPRAQCVHPVLHRSCIASPPPAKSAPTQERNSGEKVCAFCSSAARLTCGNCHGVHYCDAACQKKHWKVHRSDCKGESKPIDGESVVIDAAGKDFNGISAYMIMNMRQGAGTRSGSTDEVAHNPHGARRFLIKVQVAQTGRRDPLMMYDQPRAMSRMLLPTEGPAYDTVRDLVRARGVMGGAKAYLWARREGAQLRIFVDPAGMPDQQQPW